MLMLAVLLCVAAAVMCLVAERPADRRLLAPATAAGLIAALCALALPVLRDAQGSDAARLGVDALGLAAGVVALALAFAAVRLARQARQSAAKARALEDELRCTAEEASTQIESKEILLRELARVSPAGIFETDVQGRCVKANERWNEITGLGRDDLGAFDSVVHAEDREHVLAAWRRAVAERAPFECEFRLARADGTTAWVLSQAAPKSGSAGAFTGHVGTLSDLTRLRAAEEQSQTILRAALDGIVVTDLDGRLIDVNDAYCALTGHDRAELLGRSMADLDARRGPEEIRLWVERLRHSGGERFETSHRRKDGTLLPLEVSVRRVDAGPGRLITIVRDNTERLRAAEERRRLEERFRHAQKLESLGVLAGGIAHDFNNLLVGILGNTDLVLAELPDGSPLRERLEPVYAAASRAAALTRQMLAYSGKGAFVIEPTDLTQLAEEMSRLLESSVAKNAHLRMKLAYGLAPVEADPSQLCQVILNLVTNAAEALGQQEGTVRVSTGQRRVERAELARSILGEDLPGGTYVVLSVADTGCGMDEETAKRMFDPFFTTKFTGRGLGMAAVLGIVRGHRGAIQIDTKPGTGTTVRILLPASAGPLPRPGPAAEPAPGPARGTVLVVDDEDLVLCVARTMLARRGLTVLCAASGAEALEILGERHADIDAVLLDLTMPGMSGEQVLGEIQRLRPDVPVVLCSGFTEQDVRERCHAEAISGFVQKPYRSDELVATLRAAMQARSA